MVVWFGLVWDRRHAGHEPRCSPKHGARGTLRKDRREGRVQGSSATSERAAAHSSWDLSRHPQRGGGPLRRATSQRECVYKRFFLATQTTLTKGCMSTVGATTYSYERPRRTGDC